MKFLLIFSLSIIYSHVFALENISFEIKDPYPVCIQEVRQLEPKIPLSFFDSKPIKQKESETVGPCNDYLCDEINKNGFSGLNAFFKKDFTTVAHELFAQDLVKSGQYATRLRALNETLINCQAKTENLHKKAAQAAGDIYDEADDVDKIPDDYALSNKESDFFIFPDSDVKGYILHPKLPNEKNLPPIIAFAGTRSLKSAASDLSYGASQVNNVKVKFLQWIKSLQNENQKEVIITGHSLGGGLAQSLSAMIPPPYEIKTHVVTFNGFGGKDALKAFEAVYGKVKTNNLREFDKFQPTRDAVGYRMEGDVVSLLGDRFGETRTIPTINSKIQIISNHLMTTIDDRIINSPHALARANKEDVSPIVRPISFIVQTAAVVKRGWNNITDSLDSLFEKECKTPYSQLLKKNSKCENPDGDADICYLTGLHLKKQETQLIPALEQFKIGCQLCDKDSCVEYAVLNKVVGYENKTLTIAKRACDLGDSASCIEAGLIITKDMKDPEREKTDDKYVIMGCSYGNETLCSFNKNYFFSTKYNRLKNTLCRGVESIFDCELIFLSDQSFTKPVDITQEFRIKRFSELSSKISFNIEVKNIDGVTPLINASLNGNFEMVKFLSNLGAKTDAKTFSGKTPLIYSIENGDTKTTNFLLQRNANIESVTDSGVTPLLAASALKHTDIVKILIDRKANINARDMLGNSALLNAAGSSNIEMAQIFLAQKADVNIQDNDGKTPLELAAANGNIELIELLLANGANINAKDRNGITPILAALRNGQMDILNFFLSKNAILDSQDLNNSYIKFGAIASGNPEILKFLISKGVKLDIADSQGNSLLSVAAHGNNLDSVKILIANGANIELKNDLGATPLQSSAFGSNIEISKLLIARGANIETKDSDGQTPLMSATKENNLPLIKLLLEHKAKIESIDNDGNSAIMKAATKGNLPLVQFYVDQGANIKIVNNNGQSLLAKAIESNDFSLVKYVVGLGILPDENVSNIKASTEISQFLRPKMENKFDVINQRKK